MITTESARLVTVTSQTNKEPPSAPRWAHVNAYLRATLLLASVSAVLYYGDEFLLPYGFPWALVSLLIVTGIAMSWGARPAIFTLTLAILFEGVVVPFFKIPGLYLHGLPWQMSLMRLVLFAACGAVAIWLTYRAGRVQEQSERRRSVIGVMQRMILPERLADAPGYDAYGIYEPSSHDEEVGGDFYDFYPIEPGLYGILMGDVMGKGKEAAAYTALLRYSVRAFTSMGLGPEEVLSRLNDLIEHQQLQFETASLFVGLLEAQSGKLRFACAGHEPPLIKRASGAEETLLATGPILGTGLSATYDIDCVVLESGDALLLMTDGVTEARNEQGKFLESPSVWRLLRTALSAPSAEIGLKRFEKSLTEFIGNNRRDDIALLLLRRN